jgi:hypothetical protein
VKEIIFDVRDANTFDFVANAGLGLKITKVSLLSLQFRD